MQLVNHCTNSFYQHTPEVRVYKEGEDLIHIGAYVKGSSKRIDEAIEKIDAINGFLCQGVFEVTSFEDMKKTLESI